MVDTRVLLDADDRDVPNRDGTMTCYGLESIQVSLAGEARADGDMDRGAEWRCTHCNEPLVFEQDRPRGRKVWLAVDGNEGCKERPSAGLSELLPHEPKRVPLSWANSVTVRLDEEKNEITLMISVGDPRGAFAMTVRHREDADDLLMHLPYEEMPTPHTPITRVHDGTYRIGD